MTSIRKSQRALSDVEYSVETGDELVQWHVWSE